MPLGYEVVTLVLRYLCLFNDLYRELTIKKVPEAALPLPGEPVYGFRCAPFSVSVFGYY